MVAVMMLTCIYSGGGGTGSSLGSSVVSSASPEECWGSGLGQVAN